MNAAPPPLARAKKIPRRDVFIALAFLAVASALSLFASDYFELSQRILGIMAGLMVAFYANAVPKALKPLAKLKNPARYEALQRFIGWCLVLGGLGYAIVWITVPFAYVIPVGIALLGSSLALAVGRCFWVRRLP